MSTLIFGHVELRLAERLLLVDGQPVGLGSRGFDLLTALVAKRDRVVSKDELLDEVWPGLVVEENNLQVQISGLRRVLGARAITTVAGLGYRFTLAQGGRAQAAAAPAAATVAAHAPAAASSAARVLVADDNRVNRLLLCRSLELMGHQVRSVENGRQALELLRREPFELLLLDLAMPELDGFGLLQARADDPALREVAVIVTSALGGVAPVARCIELGADDFLHKPVDPWLLKARVDSSLASKQHRDQQREAMRRLTPAGPAEPRLLPDACVLVARLHGLAPQMHRPQETMELLSSWSTLMFDAIDGRGGEVLQFCGDGLMALFGGSEQAVQAAHEMADLGALFNEERQSRAQPPVGFGIGIARGELLVGAAVTHRRTACACVGSPALEAERLSAECSVRGQRLLMDAGTQAGLAASP